METLQVITLLEIEYFQEMNRSDSDVSSSIIAITKFITCDDGIQSIVEDCEIGGGKVEEDWVVFWWYLYQLQCFTSSNIWYGVSGWSLGLPNTRNICTGRDSDKESLDLWIIWTAISGDIRTLHILEISPAEVGREEVVIRERGEPPSHLVISHTSQPEGGGGGQQSNWNISLQSSPLIPTHNISSLHSDFYNISWEGISHSLDNIQFDSFSF